ncbi:MAG: hypothetical protein ACFCUE_12310 [Candidatus Bathyarchaeia archaeon]
MVACPECGKKVTKLLRMIDAPNFRIDEYECGGCGKRFRIIS